MIKLILELDDLQHTKDMPENATFLNMGRDDSDATLESFLENWPKTLYYRFLLKKLEDYGGGLRGYAIRNVQAVYLVDPDDEMRVL